MELAFLVYVLGLISNFHIFLKFAVILLPVAMLIFGILLNIDNWEKITSYYNSMEEVKDEARANIIRNFEYVKRLATVFAIACFLMITIPSEKTAYMMVGAYAVQKVAQDPRTAETSDKVIKLINKKLDEFIK